MSAPDRLSIRNSLEHVARYNTSLPREIKRQLRLKPGVSYEQFLAAVKADGFEAFKTFVKNHTSICLSKSFWLVFAPLATVSYHGVFANVKKDSAKGYHVNRMFIYLHHERGAVPLRNERIQAYGSYFRLINHLDCEDLVIDDYNKSMFPTDVFLGSLTRGSCLKKFVLMSIKFEATQINHQVMFRGNMRLIECSGSFQWLFGNNNIQVREMDFFNNTTRDDYNWNLFCSYVASNTFLQKLHIHTHAARDQAPYPDYTQEILARTARMHLLLAAMEKNSSLIYVDYICLCKQTIPLWNARAPRLFERNKIRQIATAPECIRRQLVRFCFDCDKFPSDFASLLYLALRASEWNDDLMLRLCHLLVSAKRAKTSADCVDDCDCVEESKSSVMKMT